MAKFRSVIRCRRERKAEREREREALLYEDPPSSCSEENDLRSGAYAAVSNQQCTHLIITVAMPRSKSRTSALERLNGLWHHTLDRNLQATNKEQYDNLSVVHQFERLEKDLSSLLTKSNCFSTAAIESFAECATLESVDLEHEKSRYAIRLTLCELASASHTGPPQCRLVATSEQVKHCATALESRPQWSARIHLLALPT